MMPGDDRDWDRPLPWASEAVPSWVSELSRDLPGRRPDRFDHLDLDADDRDDDWPWADDHPTPGTGTPREAVPYRYSARPGVRPARDDAWDSPDRPPFDQPADRRRTREPAEYELDDRVRGDRGRGVRDRDARDWQEDSRWRDEDPLERPAPPTRDARPYRSGTADPVGWSAPAVPAAPEREQRQTNQPSRYIDRPATGRARVPQPRTDDVPGRPWDGDRFLDDDRVRDDRAFLDDRRVRDDLSTDDRFARERLPDSGVPDSRIRRAPGDDRWEDDRWDVEPRKQNPWIIEHDDIQPSADDRPGSERRPAPDRDTPDLGRRDLSPPPGDPWRNDAGSEPDLGRRTGRPGEPAQFTPTVRATGPGGPGTSARDVDPATPRVVSKATPPALPRVISRSTPPAVPKVISRSTPPPAPRVIGGGAPAVGPRSVTPPPPPTVRPPAGAPPIVTRPPGIRSTAIASAAVPSDITPFPATPRAVMPAAVQPSVDPDAGSTDAPRGEGAKVIPLHRPRPAPAGRVNTGQARNVTSPPFVPADPEGDIGTDENTPGEQYSADTGGSATGSTPQAPAGTATEAGPPRVVDALLDAIAPTDLLPVALLPGPEPIEGEPAPQESPEPAEPPAEEALAAIRWRLDGATLREVVDDRESLRALGTRLDQPLSESTDNATRARLLCLRAEVFRLLDEFGMAAAASRLALAHAEAAGEPNAVVIAQGELAHALRLRGDFGAADRLFEQAASADVPELLRCVVHENAGRCCFDQGRYMEALDHFARAIRLGDPEDLDLVERIDVALEAVYIHLLRDGWGPYPRLRREILAAEPAPQAAVTAAPERPRVAPAQPGQAQLGPAPQPDGSQPPQPRQVHPALPRQSQGPRPAPSDEPRPVPPVPVPDAAAARSSAIPAELPARAEQSRPAGSDRTPLPRRVPRAPHGPDPIEGTAWIPAQARSTDEGAIAGRQRATGRAQVKGQPQIAEQAQVAERSEPAGPA